MKVQEVKPISQQVQNKALSVLAVLERAVLYARVSSDDRGKEGRNLSGQLEMGRDHSAKKGYQIVAEFAEDDRGASGYEIDLPELNKIREMAQYGEFDVLVVREMDRLSRNLAKQLIIEEELRRYGVRIEYVLADYDDSPEGQFQKHIRATVAEYEREKIKERLVRGRRLKAQAGNVITGGHAPHGYEQVKSNGKVTLEIVEIEAKIIRLIFDWYVHEGLSIRGIAKRLNERGVPPPKSIRKKEKGWLTTTVRRILKNETYAGVWHYGKANPRRIGKQKNPASNWIAIPVPAIVSRDIFEAVQVKLIENKADGRRNLKYEYLLGKRLICGDCGCKIRSRSMRNNRSKLYSYYVCPSSKSEEYISRDCQLPNFRTDRVDSIVWDWLESIIKDKGARDQGLKTYQSEQDEINKPLREQLKITEDLITDQNQKLGEALKDLDELKKRRLERAKAALLDKIEQIENLLNRLERQHSQLVEQLESQSITEQQIEDIQEFIDELAKDLDTIKQDFTSRRKLIEMLNMQVTLTVENGEKIAWVRCRLGDKRLPIEGHSIKGSARQIIFRG